MNKQKKLLLGRTIFVFIIFVILGTIVLTEKAGNIFTPKVKEKMMIYIDNNYKEIKNNFNFKGIKYEDKIFTMKVESKLNKNHYFYINYYNKKITDTYKEDYLEGKTILTYIEKKLKKEIEKETSTLCDIEIYQTLDKYTNIVKEKIIKEENLKELKFYTLKKDIIIDKWNNKIIVEKINKIINTYNEKNITPRNYTITITDKNDLTKSIEIENITEDFVNNSSNEEIINDIINNNNSKILKQYKIKYKYLN